MKSKILALIGGTLISGMAMAGGYQVNLAGQRQIGMGHTGTGLALDNASIFFNPGAMSHVTGNGLTLGGSAIISKIGYRGLGTSNTQFMTDNPLGTPFQAYGMFGVGENLKLGLGVYTPFGSTVNWGNEWSGRFGLNELSLKAIYIQPTISYKIGDKLGIGGGVTYTIGSVNLQRSLPVQGQDGSEGSIELDGKAKSAFGYNVGVFYQATDAISFGVSYRSKVNVEVEEGEVTFNNIPAAATGNFPNGTMFSASLPMPATLTVGFGLKAMEQMTIGVDVNYVGWDAYESLRFDFTQNVAGSPFSEAGRNYKNAFIYRIGGEYRVNDAIALRAGTYLDKTPVQTGYLTPETPDADALGLSAGVGFNVSESFSIDASFLYINKKERTDLSNLSGGIGGTYKSVAYIPGIALNYKF